MALGCLGGNYRYRLILEVRVTIKVTKELSNHPVAQGAIWAQDPRISPPLPSGFGCGLYHLGSPIVHYSILRYSAVLLSTLLHLDHLLRLL